MERFSCRNDATIWLQGFLVIFSLFGLGFFVHNSLLGIARQWSREKFAILTLKPRSHVRILIYRTWAIDQYNLLTFTIVLSRGYQHARLIGRQQNLERTGSDQPL